MKDNVTNLFGHGQEHNPEATETIVDQPTSYLVSTKNGETVPVEGYLSITGVGVAVLTRMNDPLSINFFIGYDNFNYVVEDDEVQSPPWEDEQEPTAE